MDGVGPATPRRLDAVTWLIAYVVTLYAIPSQLVVGALGSAGAPSMLFGLLSFGVWALYQLGRPTRFGDPLDRSSPVRRALVGFLICVGISYVVGMSRPIDADEISPADVALLSLLSWSGTLLIAHDGLLSIDRVRTLAVRISWAGALMSLLGLVQFLTNDVIIDRISIPGLREAEFEVFSRGDFVRPSGTATHPIEFGIILTMLLPFALHAAFHGRHRNQLTRWLPLLLLATATALTLSRSAYVCAAVAILVLLIGWPAQRRRVFLIGALGLGLAMFAAVPRLFGTINSLFRNVGEDPSISSRTDSYSFALEFILRDPLFGRGVGTFLTKYRIFDNEYLGMLVAIGIVGTAAFLVLAGTGFVVGFKTALSDLDPETKDLGLSIAASLAAGAVSLATFDGFAFPMTMGTFFLVLGLSGAVYRLALAPNTDSPIRTSAAIGSSDARLRDRARHPEPNRNGPSVPAALRPPDPSAGPARDRGQQ